jgi:hypothetical protein
MKTFRSHHRWVCVIVGGHLAALALCLLQVPVPAAAGTYSFLDFPGALGTRCQDISGSNIVGTYYDSIVGSHGFLYDGSTYTTIDPSGGTYTVPTSVSGNRVAGSYRDSIGRYHGFLYDGADQTYTTLDIGTAGTWANSISGSNVVGQYRDAAGVYHGFLYNGSTYTTLDPGGSTGTNATSVSGSNVVGYYTKSSRNYGFLYNGSTYTTLDYPGALSMGPTAVSGGNVVGTTYNSWSSTFSFLYDGSRYWEIGDPAAPELEGTYAVDVYGTTVVGHTTIGSYTHSIYPQAFVWDKGGPYPFTILSVPNSGRDTYANAIYGNVVVGDFYDTTTGTGRGFIYTIPEPSTLALLCVAAGLGLSRFMAYRRRHARPQQP